MEDPKVFDMDGNEKDMAWVKQKYGASFRRYAAREGQTVYRLVCLREKAGAASLVTKVLDKGGRPLNGKDVAFYWPGAPKPPDPPTESLQWDWYQNFVHGSTNLNGDIGPGMGKGAYHGEGEGGPHAVWVRDANFPSDICEKLGMLAGTFHDHLEPTFQRMVTGEIEPPPPEPPPPEPPPTEPTGWQMAIENLPAMGLRLLVMIFSRAGIAIRVKSPWGSVTNAVSGSKPEYGPGGAELPLWADGEYTVDFLDQTFKVPISRNTCVRAKFTETTGEEPKNRRLVSVKLTHAEAVELLSELEDEGLGGVFSEENI